MWREGQSFDDAFHFVKEERGIVDPNMGFACQLLQCQKRVHVVPLSPSSLLRVYRIAPHSPYDPLHLVPKMLNDPSPMALDSRGTFIIHIPSAIYIWVGEMCEVIFEREARGAVSQIVRFEKVQVLVHVIKEDEEPSFFWSLISNFAIEKASNGVNHEGFSVNKEPGERKVDLYDVDFEIVEKAIKGGFVPAVGSSETEPETHLPVRENSWSLLRRKFASGNMKEFVSNPKLVINQLLSDFKPTHCGDDNIISMPFSSSSTLSSSSSSPHLSPDSFTSNSSSNSKCSSDSPLESPLSSSSTISTLSNMSLLPSKSCASVSHNADYIEVDFGLHPIKSTNPITRRSPLSIAERRGSLSKSLRLPVVAGDEKTKDSPVDFYVDKQADGNKNDFACISFELDEQGMISDSSKDSYDISDKNRGNDASNLTETLSVSREAVTVVSANCKPEQPSVYCLPNLEKVLVSGPCDFDSCSAFIVMVPRATFPVNDSNIYLWIGKSLSFEKSYLHANGKVGDVDTSQWKKVGSDALSLMNFPDDTKVKIIREGEEPPDFFEVLSTL